MFLTLSLMCGSMLSLDFTVQHLMNTAKRYCSYTFNEDKSINLDRRVHTCDSFLGPVCHCYLKKHILQNAVKFFLSLCAIF